MLADIAYIADDEDVGAELLLKLQIELLDESVLEVSRFSGKRQPGNSVQSRHRLRDGWRRGNCFSAADGSGRTDCGAIRILAHKLT